MNLYLDKRKHFQQVIDGIFLIKNSAGYRDLCKELKQTHSGSVSKASPPVFYPSVARVVTEDNGSFDLVYSSVRDEKRFAKKYIRTLEKFAGSISGT